MINVSRETIRDSVNSVFHVKQKIIFSFETVNKSI